MKKMITISVVLLMITGTTVAMGLEKPAPMKGIVASVNDSEKTFEMKVNDDLFTVKTFEKTRFLSDMKPADFGIVVTDVELTVIGKVDRDTKTIDAIIVASGKIEAPPEAPKPNFAAAGTVKEVGENSFTFANDKGEVKVVVNEKTKYISKEGQKTFADIQTNVELTVTGSLDKEAMEVKAFVILWGRKEKEEKKPEPIVGKATNIDAQASTFTLSNKKGDLKVVITDNTRFMPKDKTLADIKDGDTVSVLGKIDKDAGTIEAQAIMIGKPEKNEGPKPVVGVASEINLEAGTFTMTAEDGKTIKVAWSEKTKFFLGKEPKTAEDLTDGATVAVVGKIDGDTLNANLVSLDGRLPKKP